MPYSSISPSTTQVSSNTFIQYVKLNHCSQGCHKVLCQKAVKYYLYIYLLKFVGILFSSEGEDGNQMSTFLSTLPLQACRSTYAGTKASVSFFALGCCRNMALQFGGPALFEDMFLGN